MIYKLKTVKIVEQYECRVCGYITSSARYYTEHKKECVEKKYSLNIEKIRHKHNLKTNYDWQMYLIDNTYSVKRA